MRNCTEWKRSSSHDDCDLFAKSIIYFLNEIKILNFNKKNNLNLQYLKLKKQRKI